METLHEKITQLKELGFTKEQAIDILEICEKEVFDKVLEDLKKTEDENIVNDFLKKIEENKNNKENLEMILEEILMYVYKGEDVKQTKETLLIKQVEEFINITKETQEIFKKYKQGDPETIKKIDEIKNDPEFKKLVEK